MLLYVTYFVFVGAIFFEGSTLFDALFTFIGVPAGGKTLVIQLASSVLIGLMLFKYGVNRQMRRDLAKFLLLWAPWLIYLYFRTDFSDLYAAKKFGRIVALQFVSLIFIIIAFNAAPQKFQRYILPVMIVMSMVLLVMFALSPTLFHLVHTGRLTLESISPVWLARTFAVAALWLLLTRKIPLWAGITSLAIFTVAIIATGSRGPLLSLYLVIFAAALVTQYGKPLFAVKAAIASMVAIVVLIVATPSVSGQINEFFSRGQSKPILEQSGRSILWNQAIQDISSSPVDGVGLGLYNRNQRRTLTASSSSQAGSSSSQFIRTYPHNVILEVLAELGVVGLALFVLILRPGRWMANFQSPYTYLFWLSFLFAMTSGDLPANSGLFMFNTLAVMAYRNRQVPSTRPT